MKNENKPDKVLELKVGKTNFLVNLYCKKERNQTCKDKIKNL